MPQNVGGGWYSKNNTKGKLMNKLNKLDVALKLLQTKHKSEIAYAMMYGYLAVMVSEEKADALLEMVQERYGK
jgi:hypothetical protein